MSIVRSEKGIRTKGIRISSAIYPTKGWNEICLPLKVCLQDVWREEHRETIAKLIYTGEVRPCGLTKSSPAAISFIGAR